ncbi:MAG: MBL fold metallo-hydrolase [Rhodospirillaceae bacterium]|nr:MBL fold metallo-hydrolase [Rhodospirillaceae bacterium]
MIFRQLFDNQSSTYTYLLASRVGGEAMIIDPVFERCERYLTLLNELDLKLVKAVDTHCHADHITGLGTLRDATRCITVMGAKTDVDVVSIRIDEGDTIDIENISMRVLYTPGHTDDSYCFAMSDRVFTGDTLLIRGTGRTNFQNGSAKAAYHSLFEKVLKLPDDTQVFPGHDYKGDTVSSIAEERAFNPRLQVSSADEYAEIMDNLNLPNPKMMDVAVPANLSIGQSLSDDPAIADATLAPDEANTCLGDVDMLFIDLREANERQRDGVIPGSLHAPYNALETAIRPGGLLNAVAAQTGKSLLLYCAYGECSALAMKALKEAGFAGVSHLGGGIDAWKENGCPVEYLT